MLSLFANVCQTLSDDMTASILNRRSAPPRRAETRRRIANRTTIDNRMLGGQQDRGGNSAKPAPSIIGVGLLIVVVIAGKRRTRP
jgi:hypothetical protein